MQYELIIVIPCYNEAQQLDGLKDDYHGFLSENKGVLLCFVDDGSADATLNTLESWKTKYPEGVSVIALEKNGGKAEAVRKAMLYCDEHFDYQYVAYLDADLATSLDECLRVYQHASESDAIQFSFGSRILKIGSVIERRTFRFLVGRIIATVISQILKLKVYDTQCGCKVIAKPLVPVLFGKPFISKWLFDVELFFRMIQKFGREEAIAKMIEVPLKRWIDRGDSKVKFSYGFKLWLDLFRIKRTYRHLRSSKPYALTQNEA